MSWREWSTCPQCGGTFDPVRGFCPSCLIIVIAEEEDVQEPESDPMDEEDARESRKYWDAVDLEADKRDARD